MNKQRLSIGSDPRAMVEYLSLRDEISKLTHPARPDVNWLNVEQLCLTLFRRNGVDLQTLAWYTAARLNHSGLNGLAESGELLDAVLTHNWTSLWPSQTHARVEILAWLSMRVLQSLRALALTYTDLPQIYRIERSFTHCCDVLQGLELKHLCKLNTVAAWMHHAAQRLETSDSQGGLSLVSTADPAYPENAFHPASAQTSEAAAPLVFVVNEPAVATGLPFTVIARRRLWQGMAVGAFLTAVVGSVVFWGLRLMSPALPAAVMPLPTPLSATQIDTLTHSSRLSEIKPATLAAARTQLETLHQLSPLWSREYAAALTRQMAALWPQDGQVAELATTLQQQWTTGALPNNALQNWQHAQQGLEMLTNQLNALDERKGKYLTGSELKSAIFSIRRSLDETPPPEELLRRMEEMQKAQDSIPPAMYEQLDSRLNQLLDRYQLLKQKRALGA